MKKILFLSLAAFMITATSCRKERTCACKTTTTEVRTGNGAGTYVTNSSTTVTKAKQTKSDFKESENCFSESYTYNESDDTPPTTHSSIFTVETSCELK